MRCCHTPQYPENWQANYTDSTLITRIVRRALDEHLIARGPEMVGLEMDLTALHLNGTPLKLDELLKAPTLDFDHDILGIQRHIDRRTAELHDFFLPRYAA